MRFTLRKSPSLTSAGDPRFRLRFLLFDVRMCRKCDRPRFTFPVPVNLKRLAAPLCVFNFGIKSSETAVSIPPAALSLNLFSQDSFDGSSESCSDKAYHSEPSEEFAFFSLRSGLGDLRRRHTRRTLRRSLVFLFLPFLLRLLRRENRVQCVPLLPGTKLYDAVRLHVFDQALEDLSA